MKGNNMERKCVSRKKKRLRTSHKLSLSPLLTKNEEKIKIKSKYIYFMVSKLSVEFNIGHK